MFFDISRIHHNSTSYWTQVSGSRHLTSLLSRQPVIYISNFYKSGLLHDRKLRFLGLERNDYLLLLCFLLSSFITRFSCSHYSLSTVNRFHKCVSCHDLNLISQDLGDISVQKVLSVCENILIRSSFPLFEISMKESSKLLPFSYFVISTLIFSISSHFSFRIIVSWFAIRQIFQEFKSNQ